MPKITFWFCIGMFVGVAVFFHGQEVGTMLGGGELD